MGKKGINAITLPVYKELMKEIGDAVKKCSNIYTTDEDITDLSNDIINKLKLGDVINNYGQLYIVTYKSDTDITFVSMDAEDICFYYLYFQ